jgi:hypothetical protein
VAVAPRLRPSPAATRARSHGPTHVCLRPFDTPVPAEEQGFAALLARHVDVPAGAWQVCLGRP